MDRFITSVVVFSRLNRTVMALCTLYGCPPHLNTCVNKKKTTTSRAQQQLSKGWRMLGIILNTQTHRNASKTITESGVQNNITCFGNCTQRSTEKQQQRHSSELYHLTFSLLPPSHTDSAVVTMIILFLVIKVFYSLLKGSIYFLKKGFFQRGRRYQNIRLLRVLS